MDKFPLMQGCFSVGELITEQEALYTWFEARCRERASGAPGRWATGESCGWAFWSPVGTGPQSGGGFPPG